MMPPETDNSKKINIQGNVTNSNVAKGKYIEQNIAHHHYGIPPELFAQYAADLGVTDNALSNFFNILQHANVDRTDLDSKLREIAQNYKNLLANAKLLEESEDPVYNSFCAKHGNILRILIPIFLNRMQRIKGWTRCCLNQDWQD